MADQTQWHLEITTDAGMAGRLIYTEGAALPAITFGWEYGGGDVIVSIQCPASYRWDTAYPWAQGRRAEIVERVASEAVRRQAPGHHYVVSDDTLIHIKK